MTNKVAIPHPLMLAGPSTDHMRPISAEGPAPLECTCDRPAVARVFVEKCDEEFLYYRRCPSCEKDKALPFSISTLEELNRFMSWNLTDEGREYKRELEEKENQRALEKRLSRVPHKHKKPGSTPGGAI